METIIAVLITATFFALLVLDTRRPAREFPRVRGWVLKGIGFFILSVVVSTVLPLLWSDLLASHRLIDATGLGTLGGAIVGILLIDLVQYAWHVMLHRSQLLWRFLHQVHHSAERIDTAGAYYLSPLDMIGFAATTSLALVWGVGVSAEAAIIANGVIGMLAIFQHANVSTPSWLGYLIQRPENHTLHHGRGIHRFNYGSLSLWDMVFGTWRNPREFRGPVGFYGGASRQLGRMMLGHDLAAEHAATTAPAMAAPQRRPRVVAGATLRIPPRRPADASPAADDRAAIDAAAQA